MPNYDELTMDELLTLKRGKETEIGVLRNELKEIARAEERLVRQEDLRRKLGGSISQTDLEIVQQLVLNQAVSTDGVESQEALGEL